MTRKALVLALYVGFVGVTVGFEIRDQDASLWLHMVRLTWAFAAGYVLSMLVRPNRAPGGLDETVQPKPSPVLESTQRALELSNQNFDRVILLLQEMKAAQNKDE